MSHSYVRNLMHCTFSTKGRSEFVDSDLESRLWPYLGGIARENRMKALAMSGTSDHIHALLPASGNDEFRQGGSVNKRRLVEMDK